MGWSEQLFIMCLPSKSAMIDSLLAEGVGLTRGQLRGMSRNRLAELYGKIFPNPPLPTDLAKIEVPGTDGKPEEGKGAEQGKQPWPPHTTTAGVHP